MIISLIAALSKNNIIGMKNTIPWNIPYDLLWFKKNTINKPVIMGRKTYESIKHPLPKRKNIVLSRSINNNIFNGTIWVNNPNQALEKAGRKEEIMIIGGGEIYKIFLPISNRLYLTYINTFFEGDTIFPKFKKKDWKIIFSKSFLSKNLTYKVYFKILEKRKYIFR